MSDYLVNPTDIVRIMNELNADNEKLAGKIPAEDRDRVRGDRA